jgi:hypothetical protein
MVSSGPVPYLNYLGGGEQRRSRRRGKIRPISVDRTEIGWLAARFPYPRQKSAGWLPDPDFYRNTSYCIRTRAWAWRPAATAFPLQLHALPSRHPPTHRSGFARDRPGLGRVVTCHSAAGMLLLKHPQRPAAGSIPAQADARQGLLHGRALLPSQDLEEVRRASCHCILLP